MNRIYVSKLDYDPTGIQVSKDDYHHLIEVSRLGIGEEFEVVVDATHWQTVRLKAVSKTLLEIDAVTPLVPVPQLPVMLTLVQGLPKGDKMEEILKKGTEIGISRFVPVVCERSIPKWDASKQRVNHDRWNKILLNAAQQSHQSAIPIVDALHSGFDSLPPAEDGSVGLVLWECEHSLHLADHLQTVSRREKAIPISMVVGPEGGLSKREVDGLVAKGFVPVTLGSSILRTENAGFAAAAIIFALMR